VLIDIPWGTGKVTVTLADHRVAGVLGANVLPAADPEGVIRAAVEGVRVGGSRQGSSDLAPVEPAGLGASEVAATPAGMPAAGLSADAFLDSAEAPLVVVVNDGTRPTPSAEALRVLRPFLDGWATRHGEWPTLLVATGTHRVATPTELERIFGPDLLAAHGGYVLCHEATDGAQLVDLGVTSRGTPIVVNRKLAEARSIILINSVEPHYFAGYTGGRKSVFPGLAGYESVWANHRLAMEAGSEALVLAGNPVHEDLEEATAVALAGKHVYSLQLVLDRDHQVGFAAAGGLAETFAQAVAVAERQFVLELDRPYEVVVAVAPYPMDCNFYQTNKAIQGAAPAVKDGGVLIVVSQCPFGLGENRLLYDRLAAASSPGQAWDRVVSEGYCLGAQQVARMAAILQRIQVWTVTSLEDQVVRDMFMRPFPDLQTALEAALAAQGPSAQVLFLKEASITVPRIRG
jgi:nickel-dependent lactate racemase